MHYQPPQVVTDDPLHGAYSVRTPRGRVFVRLPQPTPHDFCYVPCRKCGHVNPEEAECCVACEADLEKEDVVRRLASRSSISPRRVGGFALLALMAAAFTAIAFTLYAVYSDPYFGPQASRSSLLGAAFGLILILAACVQQLVVIARASRRARVREAETALATDKRQQVLLLRSFQRDHAPAQNDSWVARLVPGMQAFTAASRLATFEELLTNELYVLGPVLAIRNPDKHAKAPELGALRVPAASETWLKEVSARAASAQLIVLVLDETDGLRLELALAASESNRPRLLLVIPALPSERARSSFLDIYGRLKDGHSFLPPFEPALVAVAYSGPAGPEPLLAEQDWPNGGVRSLVIAAWLAEREREQHDLRASLTSDDA